MQEKLLHFIWKHQYFDHSGLTTENGQDVTVISPGRLNHDHGPDFLDAEILIGGISWRGHVELHIDPRQWKHHGHHRDRRYDNVILHVSWDHGGDLYRSDGTYLPNVALCDRTPTRILDRYSSLYNGMPHIPCSPQIGEASQDSIRDALETELYHHISGRAERVRKLWQDNHGDWEQTAFIWVARHFGFSVNNETFEVLASSIPYRIVLRIRDNAFLLEALLFGMAGLLNRRKIIDAYYSSLRREFAFLRHKHDLKPMLDGHEWKFLRLRPSNFPTVRIAQLAALLSASESMSALLHSTFPGIRSIRPSAYWEEHYDFGKRRKRPGGVMGQHSAHLLHMNTVIPMRWAYASSRGIPRQAHDMYICLQQLPAEDNRIIRLWKNLNINMQSALDTQGYLALYLRKCSKRACLDCPVGTNLLKHTP